MDFSALSLPLTSPVALFGVVMLIITAAPIVAKRLRLPGVVGIIVMSALIGPGALGVLERNDQVILLGTVGLLYLIFAAGLSLDLNQFMRLKHRSVTFGLLSFAFPLALGYFACHHLLGFSPGASLLIGSVVGTHTLIAYPTVRLLGLGKNKAVIMTVGATIITDALGLTILAVVVRATTGELGPLFWMIFIATLVVYVAVVLWAVPLVGKWFFRTFPNEPNGEMAFCLAMLFTVAIFTDVVGFAPLIGAFLTGLALNRLIPSSGPLMSRIQFFGDSLFVPFFLVSVGLLVDFRILFSSLSLWFSAGLFLAALYAGKFLATTLCQYIFRHSLEERMVTFGLSTPQAAATLAVTLVGFDELGLFTVETVNAVVLMILVTCVAGPMLVDRYGRRLSAGATEAATGDEEVPQRILIPLANPSTAQALMSIALAVRAPNSEEPIHPLAVATGGNDVYADVARAEKLLVSAVTVGTAAAVPVTPVTRVDVKPLDGMIRAIHELRISQVIIGWHGRKSPRERIFGTILDQLLESTSQLTMVCRVETEPKTTERVLLIVPPTAGRSPGYREALSTIKNLADRFKCDILAVTTDDVLESVEKDLARANPEVKTAFHGMGRWAAILSHLNRLADPHDMIVLLSAREKTASWRPGLNSLPSRIVGKLPQANLITVYPAEDMVSIGFMGNRAAPVFPPREESRMEPQLNPLLASLSNRSFRRRLPRKPPSSILRAIVRRAFTGKLELSRAAETALVRKLLQFELELAPGLLLLHAPLVELSEPVLLVGHSAEGVPFKGIEGPIHVIFLLISPEGFPPERHLANLAVLARLATHEETLAAVEKAESAEALGTALNQILAEGGG